MQIDTQLLYRFLGTARLEAHGFPKHKFGSVARIVRRFYCVPRTIANDCPRECQLCQATIVTAFEKIDPQIAKSPEAVLTYLMRNASCDKIEERQERKVEAAQARMADSYGTQDTTDVFDALLAELDG